MKRPNIVWLMTDEQRTDSLGFYGGAWAKTPNLDRLAADSAVFHQAYTPAPICGPARCSLLTGQLPHQTGVWNLHAPKREYRHLIDHFKSFGYQTAAFGKMHHYHQGQVFDTELDIAYSEEVQATRYPEQYQDLQEKAVVYPGPTTWILGGSFPAEASKTQEWMMVDQAIDWMGKLESDRPFFLKVSFNGPHTPVTPPSPFDTMLEGQEIRYDAVLERDNEEESTWFTLLRERYSGSGVLSSKQIQAMRAAYYGYCSFLDQQFGRLMDHLDRLGILDNTIIAYVSDHGAHLGDHGLVQKQSFYEQSVRVPFLIYDPRRTQGGVEVQTPLSTGMMLPLIAELAGIPCGHEYSGYAETVRQAMEQRIQPPGRPVISEFVINPPEAGHNGRLVMIRKGDLKLSCCLDPEPHDYFMTDLAADPNETRNVADLDEYRSSFEKLRDMVLAEQLKSV